jgi:hypothetical protein
MKALVLPLTPCPPSSNSTLIHPACPRHGTYNLGRCSRCPGPSDQTLKLALTPVSLIPAVLRINQRRYAEESCLLMR